MPNPPSHPESLLAALALSHAAGRSAGAATGPATVAWDFPELPEAVADAVEGEWGVRILRDPSAVRPQSLPAFGILFAHARIEQIVRTLAAGTNLVLPGARVRVIGDGVLAETAARVLARGGSRVIRVTADPTATLRAALEGFETAPLGDLGDALPSDLAIVTGEGHPPLSGVPGVAVDASADATGIAAPDGSGTGDVAEGAPVRPGVRRAGDGWIVAAPPVFTGAASARERRVIDLVVALSVLTARGDDADGRLAELAVAS